MNALNVRKPLWLRPQFWITAAVLIAIYVWSLGGLQFEGIQGTAKSVSASILHGFTHPDWSYVYFPEGEDLLRGLLDTVAIAVLGTFVSALLCIPFAFWASANMNAKRWTSGAGKFLLSFIRTFPEVVVAIVFIKAVGPGAFAGVLALGIHSIGMLAKLFSESIEGIDRGPVEALTACGANRLQVLWYGVFPQVLPLFYSYSLYRFEINIRSAATLGLVGAGGIGTPLIFALEVRDWSRVGIILYGVIMLVTLIDLISASIRKRIV